MAGLQISGLASGMDTESIVADLMKAQKMKVDKIEKKKMTLEMKNEVWKEMNTKIYSFYTKELFDFKSSGSYRTKSTTVGNENILAASSTASAIEGTYKIKVTQLAQGAHLYSEEIADTNVKTTDAVKFKIADGTGDPVEVEIAADASISDLVNAINEKDLDITASYDDVNKRILLSNTKMGDSSRIQISEVDTAEEKAFFSAIGLGVDATGSLNEIDATYGAIGQKSIYEYNGMVLNGDSNTVSVNGMTLTLKAESSDVVTVTVNKNVDAVYDKVKKFIAAYNNLMIEINARVDAESAKGYEPLTDEEKESLDDKTIEKWENKIKDSILRRDDVLLSLSRGMRSIMTTSSGVETSSLSQGFKYLSDIGIVTGDYSEKGVLHIEGNEDDPLYAIKENKLKKAIEEEPEKVEQLLTAIGNELYSTLNDKMKSTTMRSALTFYNDKQIKKQISDYEDKIYEMQERMDRLEQRYYKQFTAMEQAIQRANSQSASLAGMFSSNQ